MIELGLQRISRLLADTPFTWRAIHVAGTNGKGSICAYVSGMLDVYNQSNYRKHHNQKEISHGRFTSPHLIDRWDSISIRQQAISKADFEQIEQHVLARNRQQAVGASEFEIMTATAFEAFTEHHLDVAVVEVGMGGRLDATNVIGNVAKGFQPRPPPLVTAISRIGMDHQAFLGDTIGAIAVEKAGIIKPKVPVVYDSGNLPEVCEVVKAAAVQAKSRIIDLAGICPSDSKLPMYMLPSQEFITVHGGNSRHSITEEERSQVQEHVKANTSVALRATWTALQELDRIPRAADDTNHELEQLMSDMIHVPNHVHVPGRQEYISLASLVGSHKAVLLDGAHNGQSAETLGLEVNRFRRSPPDSEIDLNPITWVVAASDTKDVKEILSPLIRSGDEVFAVEFDPVDGMPWVRPMKAATILNAVLELAIDPAACHDYGNDVLGALKAASRVGGVRNNRMVVAGSLYLVGHVHRLLREASQK